MSCSSRQGCQSVVLWVGRTAAYNVSIQWLQNYYKADKLKQQHNMRRKTDQHLHYQVTGTKCPEHSKKLTEEDNLSQPIYNLDDKGLKFKHKMVAVIAPYKVYEEMQKKERQSKVTSFILKFSDHAILSL